MAKYFRWFGLKGELVLTLLLSSLAVIMAAAVRTPDRWACMAAMLFCTGGDLIIMNFRGVRRYVKHLLPTGATLFAIGHICYAFAYALLFYRGGYRFYAQQRVNGGLVGGILILFMCMSIGIITCIGFGRKRMIALVVLYGLILGGNCCMILSYAWSAATDRPLAVTAGIGVIVFLLSDIGVMMERLDRKTDWHTFVWWLYPIGQALMIISA